MELRKPESEPRSTQILGLSGWAWIGLAAALAFAFINPFVQKQPDPEWLN